MATEQKEKWNLKNLRPIIGLALVSLLICGLLFPLLITGIGQVFFPYQANGEIVQLNGQAVGSNLIAQNFTSPIFFQTRNESQSASGVDPDITLQASIFTDTQNKQCNRDSCRFLNKFSEPESGGNALDLWQPIRKRLASQSGAHKRLPFHVRELHWIIVSAYLTYSRFAKCQNVSAT